MQRVYAWIRPSLSKPAIFMKQIDTTIDGWQEVVLDEPYVITGEELYIGYSGYQPEGVKAIRVGGSDREGGCWLGARDVWEDCSKMGYGTLYIQAIGEAVLPGIDLGIGDATADKTLCKPSESVKVNFTIFNSGVETIDSYTLGYKVGDAEPVDSIIDTPIASDKRADHSLEIPMASVADGLQTVSVFCVINDEGKVDEVAGNDTIRFDVAVYSTDYPRTILIEHFTTAQCVNCPNGHRAAEKAVEGRDDYAWVAHHVGYGTDVFTIEQSKAFLDFDVLGAPSMMLDRTVVEGTTPPFTIGYSNAEAGGQLIAARLDKAKAIPAFARVAVSNEYNEDTRELTINIEGEKNAIFSDLYPECNYTVFLTEDNLVGFQTGAGPDYVHSHVLRSIETPTWGTPVQWDGNTFTATLTKELDAAWKAYDMKVIVALNKPFDAGNLANSQVLNAAVCKVDALNSIADAFVDSEIRVENGRVFSDTCTILGIYTPEGISVPNGSLSSGMYIISVADAAGMKHVIKTLIK